MFFSGSQKYCGTKIDAYTIERPLGEGRYGICFLAVSDKGSKVVIKKFRPSLWKKNAEKNMYEAVILSKLKDHRIPELLGVINHKGFYGFVLEYKRGYTVKELLFKYKHSFSNTEIFQIGIQLIRIMKYLHENGVVHRDIRIPNVLINGEEIYLIDFGLARYADHKQYCFDLDFSYLGDFLIYLLYSTYQKQEYPNLSQPKKILRLKDIPWYEELSLTLKQILFLKKLLRLEPVYESINEMETDFIETFAKSAN